MKITKLLKPVTTMFSLAVVAALLLSGCAEKEPTPAPPTSAGATKPYPLKTCVVSGEKLGSMGDPIVFVHEGQEIKLCCKNCRPDFDKDSAKYLAKLAGSPK